MRNSLSFANSLALLQEVENEREVTSNGVNLKNYQKDDAIEPVLGIEIYIKGAKKLKVLFNELNLLMNAYHKGKKLSLIHI